MQPERWVVTGTDKYGEQFEWPDGAHADEAPTQEEAEETARRMNKRGGNVAVHREVWNGPAAAYRKPKDDEKKDGFQRSAELAAEGERMRKKAAEQPTDPNDFVGGGG
jgi:hypothetical protein